MEVSLNLSLIPLFRSEFHPLHVMLRGAYKRGYQLAMDKYKGWYQTHTKTKVQI